MGSFPAEKDVQTIHGGIGRHLMVKRVSLKCVPAPTYTWKKVRNVDDESPMILNRNRRIVQDREGKISHQLVLINYFKIHGQIDMGLGAWFA